MLHECSFSKLDFGDEETGLVGLNERPLSGIATARLRV
jgi:hypothetical protein